MTTPSSAGPLSSWISCEGDDRRRAERLDESLAELRESRGASLAIERFSTLKVASVRSPGARVSCVRSPHAGRDPAAAERRRRLEQLHPVVREAVVDDAGERRVDPVADLEVRHPADEPAAEEDALEQPPVAGCAQAAGGRARGAGRSAPSASSTTSPNERVAPTTVPAGTSTRIPSRLSQKSIASLPGSNFVRPSSSTCPGIRRVGDEPHRRAAGGSRSRQRLERDEAQRRDRQVGGRRGHLLDPPADTHPVARVQRESALPGDVDPLRGRRVVVRRGALHPEALGARAVLDRRHHALDPGDPPPGERRAVIRPLQRGDRQRLEAGREGEDVGLLEVGIEVVVADEDERPPAVGQRRAERHALEVVERQAEIGEVEQQGLVRRERAPGSPADRCGRRRSAGERDRVELDLDADAGQPLAFEREQPVAVEGDQLDQAVDLNRSVGAGGVRLTASTR